MEKDMFLRVLGQICVLPERYLGTTSDILERLSWQNGPEWQTRMEGAMGKPARNDFFHETGELAGAKILIPALSRPTLPKLRKELSWVRAKDGLEVNASPTGAVMLQLGTVLRPNELFIGDAEYRRRRAGLPALGYPHGQWLVDNQDRPELAAF